MLPDLSLLKCPRVLLWFAWMALIAITVLTLPTKMASAQEIPPQLQGYWGQEAHCEAQQSVGVGSVVDNALDAPYRLETQWLSRWHFYCRILSFTPFGDGQYRASTLCGEDAVERGYNVDITLEDGPEGEALNLTWYSLDEGALDAQPWSSGPFNRCSFPQS